MKTAATIRENSLFFPFRYSGLHKGYTFTLFVLSLVYSIYLLDTEGIRGATLTMWLFVLPFTFVGLLISLRLGYTIKDNLLCTLSRTTLKRLRISISSIRRIEYGSSLGVSNLLLTYNKWDELYCYPSNKDEFVRELLKRNQQIEVVNVPQQ